jgi:hypothetical protein
MARTALWRSACGEYRYVPLMLALAISAVGSLQTAVPAHAAQTGIRGTVLWGPTSPGPTSPGQRDEAPLAASFTVYDADHAVARFESDGKGRFEVSVPAGDYTIAPDKGTPVPYPERQITQVTVPDDGYAVVTIRLDTGMK